MNRDLRQWSNVCKSFLWDELGQGFTEYALITILVAIITVIVMILMAPQIDAFINELWRFFAS